MQVVLTEDDPQRRDPGGQPRKLWPDASTLNTVRGAASVMATQAETALILGVSEKTFERFLATFTAAREAWDSGVANGKMSLRRRQFAMAEENVAMAIFLGKNYLGQSDRREVTHSHSITPIDGSMSQEEAAERYAETMRLPPSLRLVAPPVIEGEATEIEDITVEAVPEEAAASMGEEGQ